MIISDFKQLVSDYMNRDASTFDAQTPGQVDKLLLAVNNAKRFAQRRKLLDKTRVTVDLSIDRTNGGLLANCVLTKTTTPIRVHQVKHGMIPASDQSGYYPVDVIDRGTHMKRLQRRIENTYDPKVNNYLTTVSQNMSLVKDNDTIYVWPWDTNLFPNTPVTISMDVYQWMPDYGSTVMGVSVTDPTVLNDPTANFITSGVKIGNTVYNTTSNASALVTGVSGTVLSTTLPIFQLGGNYSVTSGVDTDFFLLDCTDWMLYRSIQELNLFLKADNRVLVSEKLVESAWETVCDWNARISTTPDDNDLD